MPFLLILRNPGSLRFLKVFSATGALKLILKMYALLNIFIPSLIQERQQKGEGNKSCFYGVLMICSVGL